MEEQDIIRRIRGILDRSKAEGLTDNDLDTYLRDKSYLSRFERKADGVYLVYNRKFTLLNSLIFKWYPIFLVFCVCLYPLHKLAIGSTCLATELFYLPAMGELMTPMVDCKICEGVTGAPRLTNLSQDEFVKSYAYNGKPILVEGAVLHWSAIEVFSYKYFKELYLSDSSLLEEEASSGQFFAYSSNIEGLNHFFSLPDDVANMTTEKWYIGWSFANEVLKESLDKHVGVPPFIPKVISEAGSPSWIFMGSPGPGAHLHIDSVEFPSWQAQLKGKKTWTLVPPPECEAVCHNSFNVTMNTGDVIIVDANKWYHKTYIHPGSISITIGSEYM